MHAQSKAEYETALHLDPNSRVVRQRLQELERGPAAGGPAPVSSRPGDQVGGTVPAISGVHQVIDTPETQKAAAQEQQRRDREPVLKQLKELRPASKNASSVMGKTALLWPWGFYELGSSQKATWAGAVQLLVGGLCAYVATHPTAMRQLLPSSGAPGPLDFLKNADTVVKLSLAVYALAVVYFVRLIGHDVHLCGLQGYVVGEKTDRHWITVNLGDDRGVRPSLVLHVFKEAVRGTGKGNLIGRMLVKEVGDDTCQGPYFPDTREPPALGDVVVAQETLRAKLVDLDEPMPGRFPPVEKPDDLGNARTG